jgi:hypothetical protein
MKTGIRYLVICFAVIAIAVISFGFVVDEVRLTPDYAMVLLDNENRIYHSPMHFHEDRTTTFPSDLVVVRYGNVDFKLYQPDAACRDYFEPEKETLFWVWMEDYGILQKSRPRWNSDGTWNW